jgi:hypothetical protein
MRRTPEHIDAHFAHGREYLWRFHAAAMGIATELQNKCADSLKSFLFTPNSSHNAPATKFTSKAETKQSAMNCTSSSGALFRSGFGIGVLDNCNAKADSWNNFGFSYTNDTGLDAQVFLTGSFHFQVRKIEVFEIAD